MLQLSYYCGGFSSSYNSVITGLILFFLKVIHIGLQEQSALCRYIVSRCVCSFNLRMKNLKGYCIGLFFITLGYCVVICSFCPHAALVGAAAAGEEEYMCPHSCLYDEIIILYRVCIHYYVCIESEVATIHILSLYKVVCMH